VSAVNILNLVLSQPRSAAAVGPLLQSEEGTVLSALTGLLDHSLSLLRAKALVTVMLLCR
jgi:serine/threonine-protein kinase ULK4